METSILQAQKAQIFEKIVLKLQRIIEKDSARQIPLFLRVNKSFVEKFAYIIAQNPKKNITIGVAGESASGKSTFVRSFLNVLCANQQDVCTVLTCDNYYHDTYEKFKKAGSFEAFLATGFSFDNPDAVNLDLMSDHIKELENGTTIQCPKYDFATCKSQPEGDIKNPARVIITEGLFTLNEKLSSSLDIGVYIDTPLDVIKERWYKRAASRGKTPTDADALFEKVTQEAKTHIRPHKNTADIVINGLVPQEHIELITQEIFEVFN